MTLLSVAVRNIRRSKLRTTLTLAVVAIATLFWPATWVPAAAVMPRSSQMACSQVTSGTAAVRNFVLTLAELTVELITISCLPVASPGTDALSPTTVTA